MPDFSSCWTLPTKNHHRTRAMRMSRIWRLHLPHEPEYDGRLGQLPLYAAGQITLDEALALARKYRQRLLLCCDPSVGIESKRLYHKRPPALDATCVFYYRDLLGYIIAKGAELYPAIEAGNEMGYTGWLPRHPEWEDLREFFEQYANWHRALKANAEVLHIPRTIVGGIAAWWWRDQHGRHPSLARYMIEEHGAEHVAWHLSERDSLEFIEAGCRELTRIGGKVYVTEDVYNHTDVPLINRANAAFNGGARMWAGWMAWAFAEGWFSGKGIACEDEHGEWNHDRHSELEVVSDRCGAYRPNLQPREGQPVEPPGPGPGPEIPLAPRRIRDRLGEDWDKMRARHRLMGHAPQYPDKARQEYMRDTAAGIAEVKLLDSIAKANPAEIEWMQQAEAARKALL